MNRPKYVMNRPGRTKISGESSIVTRNSRFVNNFHALVIFHKFHFQENNQF